MVEDDRMSFENPNWLYGIFLAFLFLGWFHFEVGKRKSRFEVFAEKKFWKTLAPDLEWGNATRKAYFFFGSLFFLFVALARPQWGEEEQLVPQSSSDIVIALDVSRSMLVEDVVPSRLQKSKFFIRNLLEQVQGDRVGLVLFAGAADIASPLTTDFTYVREVLELVDPESIVVQGTSLSLAIKTAKGLLERGAEDVVLSERGSSWTSGSVLVISDGEDWADDLDEVTQVISRTGIRVFTLGVGSSTGGKIPIRDQSGVLRGYHRDQSTREEVTSYLVESSLVTLAEEARGKYWRMTPAGGEIREVVQALAGESGRGTGEERRVTLQERYQWPLAIALFFLLIELSFSLRSRRAKSGVSVGFIFFSASFFTASFSGLVSPNDAHAQTNSPSLRNVIESKKGVDAFAEGRLREAKERLGRAQSEDPFQAENLYNQGVIQGAENKFSEASKAFEEAGERALEAGNSELAAKAYYNLGSAHAAQGNTEEALDAYARAIQISRENKQTEQVEQAQNRIRTLVQEEQSSGEGESDEEQDPEEQNGEGESGSDPQDGEQPQQDYQHDQISKEDAERLMGRLAEQEKEIERRMKRERQQNRARQGQLMEKDW
jgi:Ca-activated chloride channel homolog